MSLIIVESPTKAKTISQFLPKIGKELEKNVLFKKNKKEDNQVNPT